MDLEAIKSESWCCPGKGATVNAWAATARCDECGCRRTYHPTLWDRRCEQHGGGEWVEIDGVWDRLDPSVCQTRWVVLKEDA